MISDYKKFFAEILSKELESNLEETIKLIEIPPENIPGDLAFPCFQLSKTFIERHNTARAGLQGDVELIPPTSDASSSNEVKELKTSEAKRCKKSPNIIAQELATKFTDFTHFTKFTAIGGYLNAHINPSDFITNFFNLKTSKSANINNSKTKVLLEYM